MKTFWWIAGIVGAIVIGLWVRRKVVAYIGKDNARDKEEHAANIQGNAKQSQAAASYGTILPPSATFVRMNGGTIDLNRIGGNVPDLYTLPMWSSVLAPNG